MMTGLLFISETLALSTGVIVEMEVNIKSPSSP